MPLQLIPIIILGIIAVIIVIIGVKITGQELGEVLEKAEEPLKEAKFPLAIGSIALLLTVLIVGFKVIKSEF